MTTNVNATVDNGGVAASDICERTPTLRSGGEHGITTLGKIRSARTRAILNGVRV